MVAPLDAIATLLDQGAADSAVRMLRSSWEPDMPAEHRVPHYCMWIRGLCETGDLEHAVTLAKRAAQEFPRELDVLTALGNVLDLSGDLEGSRDAFALAVEVDAGSSLAQYNLGAVVERLGDENFAERCYERALELDDGPMLVEAVAALGGLLRRQGRLEEALEVYDDYLADDPLDVEILVEHGICSSDLEHFEEALDRFRTALSLEPEHGGAWYNQAITLYRLGRFDEALECMEHARLAEPNNPLTLVVLGAWRLVEENPNLDAALSHIYRGLDCLDSMVERGGIASAYAALVVEEAFEALWHAGRRGEAREIARMAGRRDWITPHMLEVVNQAEYGMDTEVRAYRVVARASRDVDASTANSPANWPQDADGYTTDLTVVAANEDEACELTLRWLSELEPTLRYEVEVVAREKRSSTPPEPRPRGVARIEQTRNFFAERR